MAPESLRFSLPSYAKVNLGLYVTGKRKDGYHELATVFQQVGLYDTLYFDIENADRSEIDLTVSNNLLVSADENNLVYQAAQLFLHVTQKHLTLAITLEKKIPIGAGLGGGSSNAAVTLLALNNALGKPLKATDLHRLAISLGADVAFFIGGGLAAASGIGEKLRPLDSRFDFTVALLCPDLTISTRWAYSQIKLQKNRSAELNDLSDLVSRSKFTDWRENMGNDFEPVVFKKYPQLQALKNGLYESGAKYASLSGSGSTVFGIFSDRKKAEIACRNFRSPLQYYLVKPMYWGLRELESHN